MKKKAFSPSHSSRSKETDDILNQLSDWIKEQESHTFSGLNELQTSPQSFEDEFKTTKKVTPPSLSKENIDDFILKAGKKRKSSESPNALETIEIFPSSELEKKKASNHVFSSHTLAYDSTPKRKLRKLNLMEDDGLEPEEAQSDLLEFSSNLLTQNTFHSSDVHSKLGELNEDTEKEEEEEEEEVIKISVEKPRKDSLTPTKQKIFQIKVKEGKSSDGNSSINTSRNSSSKLNKSNLSSSPQPPSSDDGEIYEVLADLDSLEKKQNSKKKPALSLHSTRKLPQWMEDEEVLQKLEDKEFAIWKKQKESVRKEATKFWESKGVAIYGQVREMVFPQEKGRVICFDLETTGFGPDDSIIEIGAVELVNGFRTGILFQVYAQPLNNIHPEAFQAHGLTSEFLFQHPSIESGLRSFLTWVGTSPLIAHNAKFDLRMLFQEISRAKLPLPKNHQIFCTQKYYRSLYPGKPYSLDEVATHFKVDTFVKRKVHSALNDAELLTKIYQHLLDNQPSFNLRQEYETVFI